MKKIYLQPQTVRVIFDPLMTMFGSEQISFGSEAGQNQGTDAPARGPRFI